MTHIVEVSMKRLRDIGFEAAGHWCLVNDSLQYDLNHLGKRSKILYAFVCDGHVKYIGKTIQALRTRLIGYRTPGIGQSTNIRNNKEIKALLQAGKKVDILALPDNGLLHYGGFHLNVAAGLEDSLIADVDPEWNGGKRPATNEEVPESLAVAETATDTFPLDVGPTYFEQGFFNVKVQFSELFGAHGQVIEIFFGDRTEAILGTINRTANENGTPRIMGRRHLRDWFKAHCKIGETIKVEVTSPTSIRLRQLASA